MILIGGGHASAVVIGALAPMKYNKEDTMKPSFLEPIFPPFKFGGGADGYWPNGGGDFDPDLPEI